MLVAPKGPILASKKGRFTKGKCRISQQERFRIRAGFRPGPGEASGGPAESFWDLRSGRKVMKIEEFGVFSWGK